MSHLSDALNLKQNVVIRACAGAGKTYALTKRYIAILDSFAEAAAHVPRNQWQGPQNILVITFTNKATAEMSGRIYRDIHNILSGKTIEDDHPGTAILKSTDYGYDQWLTESFNRAQIMTIDALCSKIIRENPIQAGIDPSVTVGDELSVTDIFNRTLDSFLQTLFNLNDIRFHRLFTRMGLHHLKNVLSFFSQHEFELTQWKTRWSSMSPDEILQAWRVAYEPTLPFVPISEQYAIMLDQLIAGELPSSIRGNLANHQKTITEFFGVPEMQQPTFYKKRIHPFFTTNAGTYIQRLTPILGTVAEWKSELGKDNQKKTADERLKSFLNNLADQIPTESLDFIFTEDDQQSAECIVDLVSLYREFSPILQHAKRENNILSYQDVIDYTYQLLKDNPGIARKYGETCAHIMVDEFQDTNQLRWEIIRMITSEDGNLRHRGIFIVGDGKQSIYRFQNADVKVMQNAISDLSQTMDTRPVIEFNDNYRSSEAFIQKAINPIFSQLFKSPNEPHQSFESVFLPTSYPENKPESDRERDELMDGSIQIHLMTVDYEYLQSPEKIYSNDTLAYPLQVARLIKRFQNTEQYQRLDTAPGSAKIGVLLRTVKNNITEFREAFQIEGIDFEVVSGKGFYTRQEVVDIEMLLALLINPKDDVAMVGVLRSPLFAIDDDCLTNIFAPERGGQSVYEVMALVLEDVKTEIDLWLEQITRLPVDRVLETIFNTQERELGYLSEPDGFQRWKDIQKCIRLIHNWSVNGDDLTEIHQKLRTRIDRDDVEDLAPVATSSEVVIMSIHKAKGLQFPFVVIPDIHRKLQYSQRDSVLGGELNGGVSAGYELGIAMSRIDGTSGKSVMMNLLKSQHKQEEFAEYVRLFYVAITRAKYGVLLSGVVTENRDSTFSEPKSIDDPSGNFMDWIRQVFGLTSDILNGADFHHPFADINVESYHPVTSGTNDKPLVSVPLPMPDNVVQVHAPMIHRMSVHELSEQNAQIEYTELETNTEFYGKAFGTFIHWVIENQYWDIEKYGDILRGKIATFPEGAIQLSETDWINYLIRFSEMDAIQMLQSIPSEHLFTEHAVEGYLMSADGHTKIALSGIIDALYFHDDEWVIRDYKSDTTDHRLDQYLTQIQTYMHLVKEWYHFPKIRGELVFTSQQKVVASPFDPHYYSKISLLETTGWTVSKIPSIGIELPAELEFQHDETLVICPTQYRISQLKRELSHRNLLHPSMAFETVSSLNQKYNSAPAPASLVRILLRKHLKNEFRGQSFREFPGLLNSLYRAFELADKHGYSDDSPLESHFHQALIDLLGRGYHPYLSPDLFSWSIFSGKRVIIDGWLPVFQKDINLVQSIEKYANEVIVQSIPEYPAAPESVCWYQPFDMDDEIRFMAANIKQELESGRLFDDLLIILPSMEKLVPRLVPMFKAEGIPIQLAKGEPILERPVVQACLRLLEIFPAHALTWSQLQAWFRHPIASAFADPSKNQIIKSGIYQLDLIFRRSEKSKTPLDPTKVFDLLMCDTRAKSLLTSELELAMEYIQQCVDEWRAHTEPIHTEYAIQLEKLSHQYDEPDEMNRQALDTFISVVKELNRYIHEDFSEPGEHEYRVELMETLRNRDIPTRAQAEGIPVVSVMESVNHVAGKIVFVPGLANGDFPTTTSTGFLMPDIPDYHFQTNRKIFDAWLSQSGKIYLSCATRGADGEEQSYSLFLENLEMVVVPHTPISPFISTLGKIIVPDNLSTSMNRQVHRHNALVGNPIDSPFFGKLGAGIRIPEKRYFSASQLKDLQDAPLLFLMKHIWKIRETDPVTSVPLILGNLIHHILDCFGKDHPDGWTLNRQDHLSACKLLHQIAMVEIERFAAQHYELQCQLQPFLMGLNNANEPEGLFKLILKEDCQQLLDFQFSDSERQFGYPNDDSFPILTIQHPKLGELKFRGTIDRFDIHKLDGLILGMDFKTGKIESASSLEDLPPQLKLYFLALKQEYPEHDIVMVYRQLHRLKDKKWGFTAPWLGDIRENASLLQVKSKDVNSPLASQTIAQEILQDIISVFEPLVTGYFTPWTLRSAGKTIPYYYLKGPSRIDTIRFESASSDNSESSED